MLSQSSAKMYTHQKSNSNANIQNIIQTLGDIQSNRNSSSNTYNLRNNTSGNDSSSHIACSNNNRLDSFKPITGNQQSQRSGGIAFDCQFSIQNGKNREGAKRNSSQELIQPYITKNENINTQNTRNKQQIKQHQVKNGKQDQCDNYMGNIIYSEINENNIQSCQADEKQPSQSQRASDQKKAGLTHHGGSKSLDQQTFKRMGSCPNNQVQGIQFNNQLYQSANQPFQKNTCNTGQNNFNQKQMTNINMKQGQGYNYLTNRNTLNQISSHNCNTSGSQSTSNSAFNQMNIQYYLNTNKQNQSQQQLNLISQYNPSSSHMSNNHSRGSSNIIYDYQSAKNFDQIPVKQNFDYVQNQPYISNCTENKRFILSSDLDETTEQQILQESHLEKQNQLQQIHQQSLQLIEFPTNNLKEKSSSNERIKNNSKNQEKSYQNQYNHFQKISNDLYIAKQKIPQNPKLNSKNLNTYVFNDHINNQNNAQNLIGICDMSTINNSINQRDISMIKPPNIQDISCFSRDQSMFLDANNRDISINMREQSSFFHNLKKNNNAMQTTISSGFDLQTPQEQCNYIIQIGEKTEYPTLCNPNLNNSKSLILEGLKDISINYSKVEEISTIIDQERERNYKQEENINPNEDVFQVMKEIQNDPFSHYELNQNIRHNNHQDSKLLQKIKCLQDENSILREQIVKAEEIHELKQKDLINQMNKLKQEKDEIQQILQTKIDSLVMSVNQCKKYYEDKLMKLQKQQEKDKIILEKQLHDKNSKNNGQDIFKSNYQTNTNYKQIVQQLQQELDIQKENEIIPRIKQLGDKDMSKLVECLTEMMVSFAPDGYFEKKPSLKQIWKWLKGVLKEYMRNTSDLKKAYKYVNAEEQSDFMIKLEKMVFQNESYYKIIEQMKFYFNLDTDQYSNLYELQLFLEKKNAQINKQNSNFNSDNLVKGHFDYSYTILTTDSSKM